METIEIVKSILYGFCLLYVAFMGIIFSTDGINCLVKILLIGSSIIGVVILVNFILNKPNWNLNIFPIIIASLLGLLFLLNSESHYKAVLIKLFGFLALIASIVFYCL